MTDTSDAIVKSIPKEGWNKLIDTACNTIVDILAPVTKTAAGVGALIEAKFNAMVDVQKVYAADTLARVKDKIERSKRPIADKPKSRVVVNAIENASNETEEDLREIWANLIANEMLSRSVHPDFPRVLSRLDGADALRLAKIGERAESKSVVRIAAALQRAFVDNLPFPSLPESSSFSTEHLQRLGLIENVEGIWLLTLFGKAFLAAVTDPSTQVDDERDKEVG